MQFWIFSTPSVLFSFSSQDTLRSPMSQYNVILLSARYPPSHISSVCRKYESSGSQFGVGHRSTSLILLTLLPPSPTADSGNCSSNRRRRRSYVGVAEGGRVSSSSSYFPSADMPERDAKSSSYNSDLRLERVALERERER